MKTNISFTLILIFALITGCTTSNKNQLKSQPFEDFSTQNFKEFPQNTVNGILAKVGNEAVLLSDLNNVLAANSMNQVSILPNGSIQGSSLTTEQVKNIYESLIEQKILEIKAQDLGVTVDEEELSSRINDFLTNQNLTEDDLKAQLEKSNKTMEEYRADFKKEVIKQMLIGKVISPFVTVTPDEVKAYYLQTTKNVKQIQNVKLRSLSLSIPENHNGDLESIDAVKKIKEELKKGTNFTTLVEEYSQSADARKNKGLLPPKPLAELPQVLQSQLVNLNIDQVVGPVQIGQTVFFFQYLGAELSNNNDFNKQYDSWKNKLLNIKFSEKLVQYLKNEKRNIKIIRRDFNIH